MDACSNCVRSTTDIRGQRALFGRQRANPLEERGGRLIAVKRDASAA
jgi:hypothetical protein